MIQKRVKSKQTLITRQCLTFSYTINTQFINPQIRKSHIPNPKIPKAGHPTQPPNTRPVTLTNATAAYHVTNRRRRIGFQDSLPQNYTEQAKPSRGWYQKTRLGEELKEKGKKKEKQEGGERETDRRERKSEKDRDRGRESIIVEHIQEILLLLRSNYKSKLSVWLCVVIRTEQYNLPKTRFVSQTNLETNLETSLEGLKTPYLVPAYPTATYLACLVVSQNELSDYLPTQVPKVGQRPGPRPKARTKTRIRTRIRKSSTTKLNFSGAYILLIAAVLLRG